MRLMHNLQNNFSVEDVSFDLEFENQMIFEDF